MQFQHSICTMRLQRRIVRSKEDAKMEYEVLVIETITFENLDIITESADDYIRRIFLM